MIRRTREVFKKKSINDLSEITKTLYPYKRGIQGIVVESTFNWYWIVDGLMEAGYRVHLANPSAIKQYEGLKYTDDTWDSFWLAHLLRLGILPEGHIYPKETTANKRFTAKAIDAGSPQDSTYIEYAKYGKS